VRKGEFTPHTRLLPCPFCGSREVHGSAFQDTFPYVICEKCGATGGAARENRQAVENWNRRPETLL
jgi:Lar family restriction alleviation protein